MKKQFSTTIKLHKDTKERLDKLKENDRETYDEVLRKILFILNTSRKNPLRAQNLMNKIDRSIKSKKQYSAVYPEGRKEEKEEQL